LKALVDRAAASIPFPESAADLSAVRDESPKDVAAVDLSGLFGKPLFSWDNDEPDEGELDEPTPFDGWGWEISVNVWVGAGPVVVPMHPGEVEPEPGPWPVPPLSPENVRERDPTLTERVAALVRYLTRPPAQRQDLSAEERAGCYEKAVALAQAKGPRFVTRLMGGDSREFMECQMRLENAVAHAFVWPQLDPTRGGTC
jgi:hypothetical protein